MRGGMGRKLGIRFRVGVIYPWEGVREDPIQGSEKFERIFNISPRPGLDSKGPEGPPPRGRGGPSGSPPWGGGQP